MSKTFLYPKHTRNGYDFSMSAPQIIEAVGILGLSGQWYIVKCPFHLDAGDNFRVFYPTYITYANTQCRLLKATRSGRILYKEIVS